MMDNNSDGGGGGRSACSTDTAWGNAALCVYGVPRATSRDSFNLRLSPSSQIAFFPVFLLLSMEPRASIPPRVRLRIKGQRVMDLDEGW